LPLLLPPRDGGAEGPGTLGARRSSGARLYRRPHEEIWEVILTGGDPLRAVGAAAREVTRALAAIPHVKVVRLHTRVPVVEPERDRCRLIAGAPGERQDDLCRRPRQPSARAHRRRRAALARLADAGIALLSQSVLLRGVNDDAAVLAQLMRAFVETGSSPTTCTIPTSRRAPRISACRSPRGRRWCAALRGRVSGLCQPTYVLDIPGGHGKVFLKKA
jgi:lysine 2,3-aminomutase